MFGTLGFSELIIILVIILIIFGAGRLPQIGEGVGKALRGFKKEVQDTPPPVEATGSADPNAPDISAVQGPPPGQNAAPLARQEPVGTQQNTGSQVPYQPGTEQTPGTTAALAYSGIRPEPVGPSQNAKAPANSPVAATSVPPPVSMEQRAATAVPHAQAQYPPLPPSARPTPMTSKRPSAIVNKEAVARVQAQRAAMQTKAGQGSATQDMQSVGEGLGSALRTFRQAASDVRNSIDPEMRTIQAELDAAQKEMEQSIELAKEPILPKDPPPSS